MEWSGFVPGLIGSFLVGVLLWLFLPRGVVLTRQHPIFNSQGEVMPDRWRVTNDSPITALVTSVKVSGAALPLIDRRSWWRRWIARLFTPVSRWFGPKGHDGDDPFPMWRRRGYRAAMWFVKLNSPVVGEELPVDGTFYDFNVNLSFDDETLEIVRTDWATPWKYATIPPGETLTAHVGGNTSLVIRYRRAGPFGVAERRRIVVHGYA